MIPQATTPAEVTPEILQFSRRLGANREPIAVRVEPALGSAPGQSVANLKAHVARRGGRAQFGWLLRELPGWFLEAEFHAVWAAPDGRLVDITPKPSGERVVLFLPHAQGPPGRGSPTTRYMALSNSPDVRAVVESAEWHARLHAEAQALVPQDRAPAGFAGRNDPCPCGIGLKFKKCCGRLARPMQDSRFR